MPRDEAFLATLTVSPAPPDFIALGFDCGEKELTNYICDGTSAADQAADVSRSYLVHSPEGELVAYFTILADSIKLSHKERPEGMTYGSAPAIKLGRMGAQSSFRGRGVGEWILDHVVGLAIEMSGQVGVRYVTLDALRRPGLLAFYESYGFVRNKEESRVMTWLRGLKSSDELLMVSMRYDIRL